MSTGEVVVALETLERLRERAEKAEARVRELEERWREWREADERSLAFDSPHLRAIADMRFEALRVTFESPKRSETANEPKKQEG